VIVHRRTNDKWIDDLDMRQYGWTASYYEDRRERIITKIAGNEVTVDAPVVQAIEEQYGGGEIYPCAAGGRIRQSSGSGHGWSGAQPTQRPAGLGLERICQLLLAPGIGSGAS
jgi:hypothetical protein